MAIFEVRGGPITHRYLMGKTKDELASMYMRLLKETEQDAQDAEKFRALAARCDSPESMLGITMVNNDTIPPGEARFVQGGKVVGAIVGLGPGDQPAGEPVPLPEPFGWLVADRVVGFSFCRDEPSPEVKRSYISGPVFSPARLREYAGAVAFARGMSVAEQYDRDLRKMLERAETAERERDEAKARSRYWKQRAKSAEGHLMASDLDAAARAVHSTSTLAGTDWDDLTEIQRATMTRAAALAISTINACRDARKPAGIDSAMGDGNDLGIGEHSMANDG